MPYGGYRIDDDGATPFAALVGNALSTGADVYQMRREAQEKDAARKRQAEQDRLDRAEQMARLQREGYGEGPGGEIVRTGISERNQDISMRRADATATRNLTAATQARRSQAIAAYLGATDPKEGRRLLRQVALEDPDAATYLMDKGVLAPARSESVNWQMETDPRTGQRVQVNPRTGEVRPVSMDGRPLMAPRPNTSGDGKSAGDIAREDRRRNALVDTGTRMIAEIGRDEFGKSRNPAQAARIGAVRDSVAAEIGAPAPDERVDPFASLRTAPSVPGALPSARPIEARPPAGRTAAAPAPETPGLDQDEIAGAREIVAGRPPEVARRMLAEAGFNRAEITAILGGRD